MDITAPHPLLPQCGGLFCSRCSDDCLSTIRKLTVLFCYLIMLYTLIKCDVTMMITGSIFMKLTLDLQNFGVSA